MKKYTTKPKLSKKQRRTKSQPRERTISGKRPKEKKLAAYTLCKKCDQVYNAKKRWHKDDAARGVLGAETKAQRVLCPLCKQKELHTFEGVLYLHNVPEESREEILNLIENAGKKAERRDSQDQILEIEERRNEIMVKTSENQLAGILGRKIKRAFGGNLDFRFSKKDEAERVYWQPE